MAHRRCGEPSGGGCQGYCRYFVSSCSGSFHYFVSACGRLYFPLEYESRTGMGDIMHTPRVFSVGCYYGTPYKKAYSRYPQVRFPGTVGLAGVASETYRYNSTQQGRLCNEPSCEFPEYVDGKGYEAQQIFHVIACCDNGRFRCRLSHCLYLGSAPHAGGSGYFRYAFCLLAACRADSASYGRHEPSSAGYDTCDSIRRKTYGSV